jgi:phosphate transport system permease protein
MSPPTDATATESVPADFSLTGSGNLRRRAAISRLVEAGATASALAAVAVLGVVVFGVVKRGASSISLAFLTQNPPQFGGPGGGIASAIIGTVMIVALAAAIAVPVGVLTALYLTEFAGRQSRFASVLKMALNLMQGLPTVIVGLFVFGLLVAGRGNSGFAGAIALSIVMLPLIARSSQEVLLLVPDNLREAANALGVSRWRTVVGVILPAALSGIVTGSILAIARAAGETAPLLFVDSLYTPGVQLNLFGHAVPNIPVMIFTLSEGADPSGVARAWGAALVLLAVILAANIGARVLLARSRSRSTR